VGIRGGECDGRLRRVSATPEFDFHHSEGGQAPTGALQSSNAGDEKTGSTRVEFFGLRCLVVVADDLSEQTSATGEKDPRRIGLDA
jgi:hypothetical protein